MGAIAVMSHSFLSSRFGQESSLLPRRSLEKLGSNRTQSKHWDSSGPLFGPARTGGTTCPRPRISSTPIGESGSILSRRRWDWASPIICRHSAIDFVSGMAALQPHVRTARRAWSTTRSSSGFSTTWCCRFSLLLGRVENGRGLGGRRQRRRHHPPGREAGLWPDRMCHGWFQHVHTCVCQDRGELILCVTRQGQCHGMTKPLRRAYSRGTRITSWAFIEEIELEPERYAH